MSGEQTEPFTVDDFESVSSLALEAWTVGMHEDWSVPAGELTWSCHQTADHVIDCVFSYAFMFASRRERSYPPFGELHALPEARPRHLIEGLRAVTTMLSAVIRTAPPDARAVIRRWPQVEIGGPDDFAARGGHELILHAYDVCQGLGVAFDPPRDACRRLFAVTRDWPVGTLEPTDDAWFDLVERSGRRRPAPGR